MNSAREEPRVHRGLAVLEDKIIIYYRLHLAFGEQY